jgi:hypothetical protein
MPNVELQNAIEAMRVDVSENAAGIDSAIAFIEGVNGVIQALKDQLEATGATAEQIALVTDAGLQIDAAKDKLAAALVANPGGTPGPTPVR